MTEFNRKSVSIVSEEEKKFKTWSVHLNEDENAMAEELKKFLYANGLIKSPTNYSTLKYCIIWAYNQAKKVTTS